MRLLDVWRAVEDGVELEVLKHPDRVVVVSLDVVSAGTQLVAVVAKERFAEQVVGLVEFHNDGGPRVHVVGDEGQRPIGPVGRIESLLFRWSESTRRTRTC